jgi:hypothetical protein
MMLSTLLPVLIPVAIQVAKLVGLKKWVPKKIGKVFYPVLALLLGAVSGMGFAGESSMVMAALEGAGITGLASIGVHSAAKNLSEGFNDMFR